MTQWREEPINKKHDREAFDCGEEALMAGSRVRGFISGQLSKKMRLKIKSFKRDGEAPLSSLRSVKVNRRNMPS